MFLTWTRLNGVSRGTRINFFAFLQHHVGGTEQHVLAVSMGDAAHRAHRAGDDDHGVGRIRAAGKWRVHAFEVVRLDPDGQAQAVGQFLGDDLLGVVAHHDMDFVLARVEIIEQPLRVKRAAGSGDGNENFHCTDYDQVAQNGQLIPLVLEFRGSITSTRTTTGRIELETA